MALFSSQDPGNVYKFLSVFPERLLLTQTHVNDAYNSKLVLTYIALHLFVNQIDITISKFLFKSSIFFGNPFIFFTPFKSW